MSLVHTLSYLVFCTNERSTYSTITTLKAPFYYYLFLSSFLSCLVFWKKTSTHRLLATLKAKVPWARLAIAAIASSFTHIALIGWEPNALLLACCKNTDTIAKIQTTSSHLSLVPLKTKFSQIHGWLTDHQENNVSTIYRVWQRLQIYIISFDHSGNPICLSFVCHSSGVLCQ